MTRLPLIAATFAILGAIPAAAEDYAKPGSELTVGQTATVPHLVPKGPEVPIELTITAIEEGSKADLQGFRIPAELADARPVYVRYEYTNASDENLSAQQIGSFVVVDALDRTHNPVAAMSGGSFARCATPAAAGLSKGKSAQGCALFMIPADHEIRSAAYRGHYRDGAGTDTRKAFPIYYDPVRWVAADASPALQPGSGKAIVR
jgi:hypothetical protein